MFTTRVRAFFRRHPILRDAVVWSVPALLFGFVLRALFLSYHPYAYWGSDSRSYFSFAHMLLSDGYVSLDEKRRYLYPMLMVPVSALPDTPLKWLAFFQHAMGLCAVLPLAYIARRSFHAWRWWIVPLTLCYAGMPLFLWYEHELLGEAVFFSAFLWAFAGWVAWAAQRDPARSRRIFWCFFVPLAAFLLTKPSGRFAVPGIVLGLVAVRAWRVLDWRRWLAIGLLFAVTLTVGSKKQAAWLLYVASFPLTQLDTPKHAEYKAELRAYAEPYVRGLDAYYLRDEGPFKFLESPSEENGPPLWAKLDGDAQKKRALYMDLALEGIRARPGDFLYLGAQRLIASANLSGFRTGRFESGYYPGKLERLHREAAQKLAEGKSVSIPMAFGLDARAPLPPIADLQRRISPAPGGWAERAVLGWVNAAGTVGDVVLLPPKDAPPAAAGIFRSRITVLGWWLIASLGLSAFYWRSLGVWVLAAFSYLAGVFLVSLVSPRYFAPAWLVFLPVLFVPLDLAVRALRRKNTPAS